MREFLVGLSALSSVFLLNSFYSVHAEATMQFGEPIQKELLVSLNDFFTRPDAYIGETITVESTVTNSCTRMNCWMQLETPSHSQLFRIKVNDGEMIFPISTRGKTALATGVIDVIETDSGHMYQLRPIGVEIN